MIKFIMNFVNNIDDMLLRNYWNRKLLLLVSIQLDKLLLMLIDALVYLANLINIILWWETWQRLTLAVPILLNFRNNSFLG